MPEKRSRTRRAVVELEGISSIRASNGAEGEDNFGESEGLTSPGAWPSIDPERRRPYSLVVGVFGDPRDLSKAALAFE
jgi:hypothetical protein